MERYRNGNKTWQNAENGKYNVLEGWKQNEDGKINGNGKQKGQKWEESENNKVGNVQNKTDTQTEKEDETEINERMYRDW